MKTDAAKRIMLAQSLGSTNGSITPEAQKIRDEAMQEILLTLWDTDELKALVKREHDEHCKHCPVRIRYEHERLEEENSSKAKDKGWKELAWNLVKIIGFVTVAAMAILGNVHKVDVAGTAQQVLQQR